MSDLARFLPWQHDVAAAWLGRRERFAHAWLIHGLPGIGKRQFALAAAGSLLCEAPVNGLACGLCVACQWLVSGTHPDLRRVRPDAMALEEGAGIESADEADTASPATKKAPSKEIRVEQLRGLSPWFNTATHRGGWRVALIYPARAMNAISANALLKMLEEPPEHTVFLLVADAPDRLLPTLVSRCRRLPLRVPEPSLCLSWLQAQGAARPQLWLAAAGGAPLLALQLSQSGAEPCPAWLTSLIAPLAAGKATDVGTVADQLEKLAPDVWIDALQRLFVDLMLAAASAPVRYFPGLAAETKQVAQQASHAGLADTAKWLAQQRAITGHPLNARLFVHSALQRVALACAAAV
jgi:DNA polymerase-3 subunit delta'